MSTTPYPSSFPDDSVSANDAAYYDAARDLARAYSNALTTLADIRAAVEKARQHPHHETCDGDTGCPRDLADEIHALLPPTT